MKYIHPNLFVMIPYSERYKVADYFDLNVVGEQYANTLGQLTNSLSEYVLEDGDLGYNTVICPILRAGLAMSNKLIERLPLAEIAKISMKRNLQTLAPYVDWNELDKIENVDCKKLIITDPAIATGGSILKALEIAKEYGFDDESIVVMAMFGGPTGLKKIASNYPNIKIFLAHMADGMREDGYLLPYNGDTGDRLYGIREEDK